MGDTEFENMKTILNILKTSEVAETKLFALDFLLGLTGTKEGLEALYKSANDVCKILLHLLLLPDNSVSEKACSILINFSAEENGAHLLSSVEIENDTLHQNLICKEASRNSAVSVLLHIVQSCSTVVVSQACKILSNVSRNVDISRRIFDSLENPTDTMKTVVNLLLRQTTGVNYDYLATLVSNFNQLPEVRRIFLDFDNQLLERILPLIEYEDSITRKYGVIGAIRNLCLSSDNHELLLHSNVDILPRLVLPLAGPEEFDDEDTEKLPLDLQYLPDTKTREPDPRLRKMLLEIIMQLCATKNCRETVRNNNIYVILREYHKWESNPECLIICEDLVNILIRTEDEIGVDNLQDIDVPEHIATKFKESSERLES